jgi:hypothetical protein
MKFSDDNVQTQLQARGWFPAVVARERDEPQERVGSAFHVQLEGCTLGVP